MRLPLNTDLITKAESDLTFLRVPCDFKGIRAFAALTVLSTCCAHAQEELQTMGDPFVQVTAGITACPAAMPSRYSAQEIRAQSHYRVERGNSCFQSGRCRLANSYAYDADIIARVQKYIRQDGQFSNTSIWIEGQRRWVKLMGCVANVEQKAALEAAVRSIDDVENVVSELLIISASSR